MSVATSTYDMGNIPKECWKFDMYASILNFERQINYRIAISCSGGRSMSNQSNTK